MTKVDFLNQEKTKCLLQCTVLIVFMFYSILLLLRWDLDAVREVYWYG